ncbi:MAG TPA: DUF2807 domain-containing protein [Chitinophagales bacterium]|nr:DUF2807 domain-containing protein [Chitinophagales bacterium]
MVNFKKLKQLITIQGSGNIVSKQYDISSFTKLHLSVQGNIELLQSDEEKVIVECDDNLADTFEIVNSGSTLYIICDSKIRTPAFTKCLVKVYYRQLDMLVNSSNGNLTVTQPLALRNHLELKLQANGNTSLEVNVPAMKLTNQCNGNVTLKGRCGELEIKNQPNGNLNCKDLVAAIVTIKNQANGNVELRALQSISIYHTGNGYVHYYGNGVLKQVKQNGTGEIKHVNG